MEQERGANVSSGSAGVKINAGHKSDLINVNIGKGKINVGYKEKGGTSLGVGPMSIGNEKSVYHPYEKHEPCPAPDPLTIYKMEQYENCNKSVIKDDLFDLSLNVGFEFYAIYGLTANLEFDYAYFTDKIIKIYEE